ncbi:MAG: J domain-containing protein [Microthrixaceae bacterium]
MSDTVDDDPTIARLAAHRVPGGTPHLPRLSGAASMPLPEPEPDEAPSVVMVTEGFTDEGVRSSATGSFTDWSTTESLFWGHEDASDADDERASPPDPYSALCVDPDASWAEVRRAHRKLLAELHPDRFVTASEEERREAARRLGDANQAFHQLSRERKER